MEMPEAEEGETRYCEDNGDGTRVDPDKDFSHLDTKIKSLLGHFLKDFEGGVPALKSGTKFDGYGSFLPPCQYSPSAWCHPDSPQQFPKHSKSSSPDRSSIPDGRPPPSAVPFAGSEIATCDSHFLDSSRLPSSDLSIKHDLFSTSSRAIEQFPVEQGTSNKPANPTNKRKLKFRIKVGSSSLKQSSAGGIPVQFSEPLNQSPTSIIQIMTSFPVTGEKILSPLNVDFLSLTRKATPDGYDKPTVDLRVTQRHNDIPVNESSRRQVGVTVPKEDKVKLEPNHDIGKKINNVINSSSQEKTNHQSLVGRECSSGGMKPKLLAMPTSYERDSTKGSSLMCGATKKLNKGTSPGIAMDDSYELISAQSGCGEKQKAGDCSSETIMDCSVDIRKDGSAENNCICAQFKASFDKSQSEEIPNVRLIQPSKKKIVKRKSCKSKMQTLNSQSNIYKVGNKQRDSLRNVISGVMDKQAVLAQRRPLGEDSMDSGPMASSKEQNTLFTKSKEQHCKGNERKFALEGTLEEVANTNTQLAVGPLTSENTASTEINDDWVQCDNCETWRLFPSDIKPEQLPDKWMCSMQHWLRPGMNRCDISMEEGTIAFYALNRPPVLEAQTSMHDPASGTATGINFDNIQQLGSCHHDPSYDFMQNGRKEDPESKKIPRSHQHESAKCWSLHMKQCHPESNPIKKPSSPLSSITVAKRTDLQKRNVKQINGGIAKQTGQKSKREADESVYGASKKTRQEGDADLMKVGVNSRSCSSSKTSGKHMQQHNELSYSKDARGKILGQKQSDCHVSLDGHMDGCKDNFNAKKRKLKDSLDGKVSAEEVSIEDGFSKEKKSLMNLRSKESNTIKGDCNSSKKCRVSRMPSTGSAENPFVSKERVKKLSNNERPMKQSKIFSQGMNSLERDLVSNAASGIAASGSSMISSSHKSKVSFQQVKGSPVESVSSSPFRASILKNISSARKGASEKDDAMDGCHFLTCTPRRYPAVKQNGEKRLSSSYDSLNLCEKLDGQHSYAIKNFCDTDKSNVESRSEKVNCHLMEGVSFVSKTNVRDSVDVHPLGCHFNKDSCSEQCENNCSKDEKKGLVKKVFLGRCSNDRVTVNEADRRANLEAGNISDQLFESRVLNQQTLSNPCDKPKRLVLGSQSVPGLQKHGDVSGDNNVSSFPKHMGFVASSGCGQNAPIPLRNDDFALTAAEALQKAKELQEDAEILKSSGFAFESNEVCFQCGLQFLHGISLLEACSGENIRHGNMNQIQLYSRTAKIFGSCAHEYERCNELVAAALAYKCVEVAHMRIVSCRHLSTDRDLHELQAALQMLPNGESPGSSLSDVDNLNIQAAVDKAALSRETNSHDAGSHVFIAQNYSNVIRLFDFVRKVKSGMEASRETQKAFAAAKEILKQSSNSDVIASVQKAISFSFQDVEGFVRLVNGAISCAGFGGRKD